MTTQLIYCIPKFSEAQRIVTYLDGLPPIGNLRYPYGHRQVKVNALRELQVKSGEGLSPALHFAPFRERFAGGASRSALIPSVLDRAFKGEL